MNQYTNEQQLLIDEVIAKGYNQEDFEAFVLLKEPEKGHDLNQWTYDELSNIIKLFQEKKQESPLIQQTASDPDSPDISEIYHDPPSQQEPIKINEKLHLTPYQKTIHCKKMNYLIDENVELQFEISPPVEERGGILDFFSKTIVFPITVSPMQWKVKRTLQDFIQLRNILCSTFPEYIIPSFPYNDIDDYDIIMKEQQSIVKVLTVFLQIYNKKTVIRTCPSSLLFLSETNQKQFQTKFYKEQMLTKQYVLNQKQSQTGTLQIAFNSYQYQKYKDYQTYLNGEQNNYDIIQKHLEQFAEFTYKGQQCLGFSIEMIQQLCLSIPQYFEAQEFGKTLQMIKSYFQTSKDFVLRSTRQIMDVLLITLVKFKNSRQQLFELRNNLNESFQNFSNEFQLLEKRKEELFTLKDLSKWGLNAEQTASMDINKCYTELKYAKECMLPKETFQVNERKDQYVYMLNHFNEQFDQQFLFETEKLMNEIEIYLENMRQYTNNQLHNWDFLIQEYQEYKLTYTQQLTVK